MSDSIAKTAFLFHSLPRHDGHYTSTPWQIARELSEDHPVMFVDNPLSFSDLVTGIHKPQVRKRLKSYFRKRTFVKDGVEVILPPFVWPINFLPRGWLYDFFSSWNHRIVARRINHALRKKKIHSLIYVNAFNFYFPWLHRYLEARVILNTYYCIDPMIKPFTLRHGKYLQDIAASQADTIISTAPALHRAFVKKGYRKSHVVPNAADYQLFSAVNAGVPDHPLVKTITGRIIGYIGNIERRIDFKLLLQTMELLPGWQLVMVGPVDRKYVPVEFFAHPRIHMIGPVPHHEAPSILRKFDVAIVPFKQDEVSEGIYPLKLFEYLASGKPVVTTNFNPEVLQELKGIVYTTNHERSFAELIVEAYASDSTDLQRARQKIASENNWASRAELFKSIISTAFNSRQLCY